MKALGIALTITASVATAYLSSHRLEKRVALLESIINSLNLIRDEIRYKGSPLKAVMQNAAKAYAGVQLPFFEKCIALLESRPSLSFQQAWEMSLSRCEDEIPLKDNELDALKQFGAGLGKSDLDGQLTHCGYYISVFGEYLAQARKDKEKYSRLYRSLSLLSGTLMIILLI